MSPDFESAVRDAVRAESERIVPPAGLDAAIVAAIGSTKPSPRRGSAYRQLAAAVGITLLALGAVLGAQLLRGQNRITPPISASQIPSGIQASETPSPSASASPSPTVTPSPSPSLRSSATPFNPGYAVPDAATQSGIGYDPVHGYPILLNQQHTGNPDPGYPTFPTWKWTGSRWVQLSQGRTGIQSNVVYDPTIGMSVAVSFDANALVGWNGAAWVSVAPLAGSGTYLAFDQARNVLVLLNESSVVSGETSTYDGRTWTKVKSGPTPSGRAAAAFAYDPDTRTVLLFGGIDVSEQFGDTWEWNGTAWTQLHPDKAPAPGAAVMGYDSATHQMVLIASNGTTWQWTGHTWSQITIASPPLGSYAGLVYDAVHQYLLLWEGNGGIEQGSQTWSYSSSGWKQVS
jgi:hypothetical protein